MAEVKKVEKTAESTGFQNVSQADADAAALAQPGTVPVDTAVRQAAATVPGSEAAAEEAMPSDEAVAEYLKTYPAHSKTFRDVTRERQEALLRGDEPNNEAYPVAARDVKPSKRTEAEAKRGKQAQGDAAHQQGDFVPQTVDQAGRQAKEYNRNKEAEKQVERVLGVEDAPPELKARPGEPPEVEDTKKSKK